jgi:hypothetical protein
MTRAWPFFPDLDGETLPWPDDEPSLENAVASIVGIAAQRALSSGTLDALRAAVEAALQAAPASAEGDAPSRITRADPPQAPSRLTDRGGAGRGLA